MVALGIHLIDNSDPEAGQLGVEMGRCHARETLETVRRR